MDKYSGMVTWTITIQPGQERKLTPGVQYKISEGQKGDIGIIFINELWNLPITWR
jgi:hypothetical protein